MQGANQTDLTEVESDNAAGGKPLQMLRDIADLKRENDSDDYEREEDNSANYEEDEFMGDYDDLGIKEDNEELLDNG